MSLLLPVALVVSACTDSPVAPSAGGLNAAAAPPIGELAATLPWRIKATVATTPASPPVGCVVFFTSVIEGTATHLGRFAGAGTTCVLDQIAPDPDPPFLPAGPPPYVTANFTNPRWTLTSSSGDELWIESVEAVAVISLTDGSLRAEGRQRILGGTGRFAGATGEATIGAANEDGQGPDDFEGRGWILFRR
jgi:hypothetical protein